MDTWTISGTIASLLGLAVGIGTLYVAHGAKEAAERASLRSRERDLVEELEAAHEKVNQVGIFLMNGDWSVAHLRAAEVQNTCKGTAVRWAGSLSENDRNDLLNAGELAHSIASAAQEFKIGPDSPDKRKRLGKIQLRAAQLISGALAEARGVAERTQND